MQYNRRLYTTSSCQLRLLHPRAYSLFVGIRYPLPVSHPDRAHSKRLRLLHVNVLQAILFRPADCRHPAENYSRRVPHHGTRSGHDRQPIFWRSSLQNRVRKFNFQRIYQSRVDYGMHMVHLLDLRNSVV